MELLLFTFFIALVLLLYIAWEYMKRNGSPTDCPVKVLIVLGSGGHTSEMVKLVEGLNPKNYNPIQFVYAETDSGSIKYLASKKIPYAYSVSSIPRSREVGQSYVSSIFSTVRAFIYSFGLVWRERPSLLLMNGPGTCIPVAFSVLLLRVFCLIQCRIVYVESICRVKTSLSLSGRLLYNFVDDFIVQWPGLREKYPRSQYLGILM